MAHNSICPQCIEQDIEHLSTPLYNKKRVRVHQVFVGKEAGFSRQTFSVRIAKLLVEGSFWPLDNLNIPNILHMTNLVKIVTEGRRMPKAFSEQEKKVIRQQIRDKSKRLFEMYGLRKTSVDDITQAVGISKGAFYLFYESKEELFLELMEQMESELRESILGYTFQPREKAHQHVRQILSRFLLTYEAYPLLKNFSQSDFDYLVRKLPAERAQAHMNRDSKFFDSLIKKVKREGIPLKVPPRVAMNLILSLFLVSLHRHEIGEDTYTETMQILTDLVAGYITEGDA